MSRIHKSSLDTLASREMNRLADGELHVIQINGDWFCFDVKHPYKFYKFTAVGQQCEEDESEEFHTMFRIAEHNSDNYTVDVFWYPDASRDGEAYIQLFKDNGKTQIDETEKSETTLTVCFEEDVPCFDK